MIDLNVTRAYRSVYLNVKSDSTARTNGSRLLANANVIEYANGCKLKRQKRNEISQDMIINELRKLGFAEIELSTIKPSDKIKALEIISKMLGLDSTNEEQTMQHNDLITAIKKVMTS